MIRWFVLLFLILACDSGDDKGSSMSKSERKNQQAQTAFSNGDYATALTRFMESLDAAKTNAELLDANNGVGWSTLRLDPNNAELETVRNYFDAARLIDSDNDAALFGIMTTDFARRAELNHSQLEATLALYSQFAGDGLQFDLDDRISMNHVDLLRAQLQFELGHYSNCQATITAVASQLSISHSLDPESTFYVTELQQLIEDVRLRLRSDFLNG